MLSINEVIHQLFPSDKLEYTIVGYINHLTGPRLGKISIPTDAGGEIFPLTVIETDKHIFIDKRQGSFGFILHLSNVLSMICGLVFVLAVYYYTQNPLLIGIGFIFGFLLAQLYFYIISSPLNIFVVKKTWVEDIKITEESYSFSGNSPKGIHPTLAYLINTEQIKKLPLLDQILIPILTLNKTFLTKSLTDHSFTYTINFKS